MKNSFQGGREAIREHEIEIGRRTDEDQELFGRKSEMNIISLLFCNWCERQAGAPTRDTEGYLKQYTDTGEMEALITRLRGVVVADTVGAGMV